MAKSADELERELELRREQLHVRVDTLRHRAAGDVRGMQHETQEELTSYVHKAESQVKQHMGFVVAGGLISGVLLGLTAPSRLRGRHKTTVRKAPDAKGHNTQMLLRGLGMLGGVAGDQVKYELRTSGHHAAGRLIRKAIGRR